MITKVTIACGARWRFLSKTAAICAVLALNASCGLFGKGPDEDPIYKFGEENIGCLNNLGARTREYLDGRVDPAVWARTFDCAVDSLNLFKQYVKGEGPEGAYSQKDLLYLASNVLVTNAPISEQLVMAQFAIKSSLLGGSTQYFTNADIDRIIANLKLVKEESLRLLPMVREIHDHPTFDLLLEFSDLLQTSVQRFADFLGNGGVSHLTAEVLADLFNGYSHTFGWKFPDRMVEQALAAKDILISGGTEAILASDWPTLARIAGQIGGPALAIYLAQQKHLKSDEPNAYGEFLLKGVDRMNIALTRAIELHDGQIPLEKFFHALDVIPAEWLPVTPATLKAIAGPFVAKILWSASDQELDQNAVSVGVGLFAQWVHGQTAIESIFKESELKPAGVSLEVFKEAADAYVKARTPAAKPLADRIVALATQFKPLYADGDKLVTLTRMTRYSQTQISKMHWMNLVSKHAVRSYMSPLARATGVDQPGLNTFINDFYTLGVELKLIDPTVPGFADRRFRDGDLFVYHANGDGYVDPNEVTMLIAFLTSVGSMTATVGDVLQPICRLPDTEERDPADWYWMDPTCFRREYFARYKTFWSNAPHFIQYYETLSSGDRAAIQDYLEAGGRLKGKTNDRIASYDVSGIVGVVHYIEALFLRFDGDGDEQLARGEAMNSFPLFKRVMAIQAKEDDTETLQAVFFYLLKYGKKPDTSTTGKVKFYLWWKLVKPFLSLDTQRITIYKIMPLFKGEEPQKMLSALHEGPSPN